MWRPGDPQSAADAPGPTPTFDEALSLACALLNPVLKGPMSGNWDPAAASWTRPADLQPTRPTGTDGPNTESAFNESFANCRDGGPCRRPARRSEEHTSELQSLRHLV